LGTIFTGHMTKPAVSKHWSSASGIAPCRSRKAVVYYSNNNNINNNNIAVTNLPVLLLLLKFIFVDCVQTLRWEHLTRAKELCIYSTEVQKVFIPNHPSGSMPDSFQLWSSHCGPLATVCQPEWTWTSMATRT